MNVAIVMGFLKGARSLKELQTDIRGEVQSYESLTQTDGSRIPILVEEDPDADHVVGNAEALVLCKAFLEGQLTAAEVGYIADAIQLSESVYPGTPEAMEALFAMADPEINGPFTREVAMECMASLGSS